MNFYCYLTAFSLAFVYAGLTDITIANCVGVNGGGLYANQVGLYLEDTRWINNTADVGGAVFLNWGEGTFTGVNEFVNNTASIAAGAVCGNYVTFFHFDAADVITSGNYAPVGTPSNYYMDQFGGIHYLGSTVPTYAVGPNVPNPVYYVDSRVDCTRVLCNGSAEYPYGTLNNATNALYWIGGTLNIMPGVYTGPDNIQLTFSDANVVVQQWPNTTGQVILDCQNEGWGIWLYDLAITISDITIQNCNNLNRPKGTTGFGGGAILGEYTMTILTNVHFINNTATVGSGGAMFMNLSQLIVDGGSFVNNTAAVEGGAVMMSSAVGRFSNNVLFEANTINRTENQDLSCFKAELQNDGSVTFAVGQDVNCFVSITSPTATAVFPGSLQGVLYPKNSAGATQADMFASLNFLSIVELDHTGHPIESTRLHKHDLEWILTVSNNSDSANSVTLEYDALGPNHEFIALIHTFFIDDGMYHAMGVPQPIAVPAGVIKTSIEVAMWPFQSHKHSLSITLSGTTPAPITSLKQHMAADQSAEVRFETADLTVLFSALPVAVYDSLTNVGKVTLTTKQYSPTAVHFEFVFSYFELWTGYTFLFFFFAPPFTLQVINLLSFRLLPPTGMIRSSACCWVGPRVAVVGRIVAVLRWALFWDSHWD